MTDETATAGSGDAQQQPQQPAPQLRVLTQYVKDLSFENPAAGQSLQARPDIRISINVEANKRENDQFEVSLKVNATANVNNEPAFVAELDYAGVFMAANIPEAQVQPVLLIECPRILFPFARRVMADVTRDGGYPPLMLDPIDFLALYRQQSAQQAAESANATANGGGEAASS